MNDRSARFSMQESEYAFPYHHIPYFSDEATPCIHRVMSWGLEYLCYTRHVIEIVRGLQPDSVLDVGCGDGRLLSDMPTIDRRLGIDLSERAIGLANALGNASFICADVRDLSEKFDVATCVEVLEHVPDDAEVSFLAAIGRRVNPGGHIVISVPSVLRPVHPKHFRHYSEASLRKTIAAALPDWEVVSLNGIFLESKIQAVCRKMLQNRFWTLNVPILSRWMWKSLWRNRVCSESRGAHLVAVCGAPKH